MTECQVRFGDGLRLTIGTRKSSLGFPGRHPHPPCPAHCRQVDLGAKPRVRILVESMATEQELTIRSFETESDYDACIALQRETWGDDFRELVPPAVLMIAQKMGGVAAGAFDRKNRLVGFVFGITGLKDGRPAHWSHMLAVTERLRSAGIGQRLKFFQRDYLRRLGVETMFWTYDPLVSRNAHLNLNRLGARITEYVDDMYGHHPVGKMDSVIGSDRFIVEWALQEETKVADEDALARAAVDAPVVALTEHADLGTDAAPLPRANTVRIEIPFDIQELKQREPGIARQWRVLTRRAFHHYLARGYTVQGLQRDSPSNRCFYLLSYPTAP